MKKLIAVILILAALLGLCACGGDAMAEKVFGDSKTDGGKEQKPVVTIDAGAMILTEAGTVPDGVHFVSGGILVTYKDDLEKVQILNQNGQSFAERWYDDIDSIVCNGVCVVSNTDSDGNVRVGIVDSVREKELVPCEAVEVLLLSERFVLVGYETGAGTEDDRFGTYYIDSKSIYYKGYGKVLDLEKGAFVPGLEITTSKYDVSAAGNMIYVEKEYPTTDVYTAEGELFGSYERLYPYPDSGIVLQSTVEGVCVYDENMKLVSTLVTADYNDRYEAVDGTSEMLLRTFAVTEGDALVNRYCVIDLSGKALSREYERILQVYPQGYLSVMEGEEKRIVDFEGNTMVSGFYAAHYDEAGYFVVKVQDEGYYVYDRAGKKINETAMANVTNGLIFADNAGNVLVLETGEMLASDGFHKARMGSLVLIADTLYDVITGKAVLTGIDSCGAVGDSLYIWDDETETYTRYIAAYKSKD